MCCYTEPDGTTYAGNFFYHSFIFKIRKPRTAILFRNKYTHHAQLSHFFKYLKREFLCFIPFHYMRANVLLRKVTGSLPYLLCYFRGFKIHWAANVTVSCKEAKERDWNKELGI